MVLFYMEMLTTICNKTSRISDALFWTPQGPGIHVVHMHAGKAATDITNNSILL